MSFLAVALAGLALAVVIVTTIRGQARSGPSRIDQEQREAISRIQGEVSALTDATRSLRAHLVDVDAWRNDIVVAVAEGIKHVERAENRVRATVRRAREELDSLGVEHPGLEAEARELRLVDGGGGREEGVPSVPEGVGPGEPDAPAGFPGHFPAGFMRRVRGS